MKDSRRPRRDGMREVREFDQRIIDIARVTRVMAGGKRMRFRACVVIGDHKGRVAYGIGKGADVTLAVNKAVNNAKKDMIHVPSVNNTIPHAIHKKYKASRLLLKPAPRGTGIMAGGAVRLALELSGLSDIVAKMYGSKNKINNVRSLFEAFHDLSESLAQRTHAHHEEKQGETLAESGEAVAAPKK